MFFCLFVLFQKSVNCTPRVKSQIQLPVFVNNVKKVLLECERKKGGEGVRKENKEALYSGVCSIHSYVPYIYPLPSTWLTEPLSLEGGSNLPILRECIMTDLNQWS